MYTNSEKSGAYVLYTIYIFHKYLRSVILIHIIIFENCIVYTFTYTIYTMMHKN